jgi:hypothetical protein
MVAEAHVSGPVFVLHMVSGLLTAAAAVLLIVIVRAVTHGPVGREPVAAQPGSVPQAWPGPANINTASTWPSLVTAVPCTREHLAEVSFAGNHWRAASAFPGNAVIYHQAQVECRKVFRAYDGFPYSARHTRTIMYLRKAGLTGIRVTGCCSVSPISGRTSTQAGSLCTHRSRVLAVEAGAAAFSA